MGARGNSGVILSQIIRGAAEVLGSEAAIDARVVAGAVQSARDAAYRAVREPVEGTMLSVIRELAEESENANDDGIPELLTRLVRRGEEAVARTPEQLAVLREAGVVDAGGAGLFEIVRGIAATVTGEGLPDAPFEREELNVDAIHQELSKYRYCTTFMIEGDDLDSDAIEAEMLQLGDSLLVVGDPEALKVHVHTDDPGRALGVGTRLGTIERVEIANMHEQTHQREERLLQAVPDAPPTASGVVAVVAGDGNRKLFESLGAAKIVEGGQTMNPSTAELVAAIEANACRRGDRPAEQLERDPVRRPGCWGHVETGPGRPDRLDSRRSRRDGRVRAGPDGRGERRGDARPARERQDRRGDEGLTRRRDERARGSQGRVARARGWRGDRRRPGLRGSGGGRGRTPAGGAARAADPPEGSRRAGPRTGSSKRIEELHPGLELDVQDGGQPHYPLLLSAE